MFIKIITHSISSHFLNVGLLWRVPPNRTGRCSGNWQSRHLHKQRSCAKSALERREGSNLRDAFLKFEEASGSDHTVATKELAECYLHERGCERDLMKAAELGNSRSALTLGMKMKMEGKESECVRYL